MEYLQVLYLFVPAFVANCTPVIMLNVPVIKKWDAPVCQELFGKNKSWRGLILGTAAAVLIALVQHLLFKAGLITLTSVHDSLKNTLTLGFLMGFGALAGDIVESYFKRRLKIMPGKPLPVFDGIDYMIGAVVLIMPFYKISIWQFLFLLIIGPVASLAANIVAYLVGWKKVWH